MSTDTTALDPHAVAVVGLACRFGPADSAGALWDLWRSGHSGIRRYEPAELVALGHDERTLRRSGFVPYGSVLAGAEAFDAAVFGYSPQHAAWLDPQQRLLLETSRHALEDAALDPRGGDRPTGVFLSVGQPVNPPVRITELDAAGMMRFSSTDKDFAATRVSYKLGLTGPSLTVQTACSSSLVGIHLAVESLLGEECDIAVAGGVSLHFPQAGYLAGPDMILSPTGGCRPFDDAADGTVFGNGVGVVVLRRLADALADGDPIRAVIRGSAVNNDGDRKMDYHAPSPHGQEAAIREALALGGVPAASVGYVETHGTGTHLGDPVEFSALAQVYGAVSGRAEPCVLGSVKHLVGHTNTAAGVAGFIAAVLALEHGTVPATAYLAVPNRRIPIDGSGLRIGPAGPAWPVPQGPRRAAVSSFGIGGTNAHVVLEQAPAAAAPVPAPRERLVVAVSAHTPAALDAAAGQLADALDAALAGGDPPALRDVVATLTHGRSHERERLAVVADDLSAAIAGLRDGSGMRGSLAAGQRRDTPVPAVESPEAAARAWVGGSGALPPAAPGARRLRLPGYPYERREFPRPAGPDAAPERLAALLDRNVSTVDGIAFERFLEPDEPLVADHVVAGEAILPAAAQLDMALAAGQQALGVPLAGLTGVTFHRPVRVAARTRLTAELDADRRTVRIVSDVDGVRTVHAEGEVLTGAGPDGLPVSAEGTARVPAAEVYGRFAGNGVEYGPAFQVVDELHAGPDGAVATVTAAARDGHRVSPYLLDGVLQTVLGCLGADTLGGETYIPFAIERLEAAAALPERIHVQARPTATAGSGRRVRKFDLTATDDDGAVVLRLTGLTLRPTAPAPAAPVAGSPWPEGLHAYAPTTRQVASGALPAGPVILLEGTDAQAAALGLPGVLREVPESVPAEPPLVVWPMPAGDSREQGLRLIAMLRGLLRPLSRTGARIVVPYPPGCAAGRGAAAVGRSLAQENPRFALVAVEATEAGWAGAVRTAAGALPPSRHLVGGRATGLARIAPVPGAGAAFVPGGRYWINGMGRLAEHLAAHLLERYGAHVILTGRSPATGDRAAALQRLSSLGGTVEYHCLDCTDATAVREFAAGQRPVRGVLHCAGVLRDSFLIRKTPESAAQVLDPKLLGAAALDAATADWQLDHFVVFSSVSAALGSAGQADYAFANAAVDAFAVERAGRRAGRTLSVAWPYWAQGAMGSGDAVEEVLAGAGMRPLSTADGMAALEVLLTAPDVPADPVLLAGDRTRMEEAFPILGGDAPQPPGEPPASGEPGADVRAAVCDRVTEILAEATGNPADAIDADRHFDDLGIDSLLVIRIVEMLRADFGRQPKTLLFECQTVAELTDHLLQDCPQRCADLLPASAAPAGDAAAQAPTEPAPAARETVVDVIDPVPAGQAAAAGAAGPGRAEGAIAIIGMAGRYPGGADAHEFWQTLAAGGDLVTEVPADRWDAAALYDADRNRVDRTHTKWGSFLDGVADFDAPLFHMSPREAGVTDPQARLMLQSCWSVLEDAGYRPDALVTTDDPLRRRDVGVFVGVMYGEYQLHEAEERLRGNPVLANSSYWSIANRVSYFFDFQGPSVAVDTACSSALTAVHMACESLRSGSCQVAIAGGVNVLIHPNKYFMLGQGRFASSDGRCRSFGAGGDGYVPGEGVGTVLLKPLEAALADGDHIHGVILATAANHGGRTNGYTVPNPRAQADLVGKALQEAGLGADAIDYVEAHGTGTALGDPIEVRGLTSAFRRAGDPGTGPVPIGSVKSNLGHLESAAGVVALHKVLLQLRHRTLVPSLHADPPNPEIDFAATPFVVQREVAPWHSRDGGPLRAGISSFGAGGANAHIIVAQPPPAPPRAPDSGEPVVVFLSARTDAALRAYAERLREHLARERPALADVAYTFAVGRAELAQRCALEASSLEELLAGLDRVARGERPGTAGTADWEAGGRCDRLAACGAGDRGRRIPLPHYPFEAIRCWYDNQIEHLDAQRDALDPPPRPSLRDFGRPAPAAEERDFGRPAPAAEERDFGRPAPAAEEPVPAVPALSLRRPITVKGETMSRQQKVVLAPLTRTGPTIGAPAATPGPARPEPAGPAPSSRPAPVAAGPDVEAAVAERLAEVLYLEPGALDIRSSFQDLGVDSILGVEFVRALNDRLGISVKATALYDHPTPADLANHVRGLLSAAAAPAAPAAAAPAPVVQTPAAAERAAAGGGSDGAEIRRRLRTRIAEVLFLQPGELDDHTSFHELGLDSILGVELVTGINHEYGLDVKAGVLYDHPTIADLAAHLGGLTAGSPGAPSGTDAVLAAVRDGSLSVDQALGLLQATTKEIR
ncbi:beta-ketoacyl synthase N-terminal-like domain-containing protein [Couchioplanes azureus]|uniref:beta-ketoacyl synthase N-terminal-like domain-containing protein n=1 Tax=Couchioplanes caeruleus TaxID=56438 RepID=UPI00166FFB80|nr:beta-ketoacyl synthase N-terminal-like domain-containing protein [Couchioplanes caeruleus]GGQ76172.1 hypothetical protein GCM10010166_52960 [Couchioplanes caeruleus subsp. azureus]